MVRASRYLFGPFLALGVAQSTPATVPPSDLVGTLGYHITSAEDTLIDLAQKHRIGYVEIRAANPAVDPWLPGADRKILLPDRHILPEGQRNGIVINLGDLRLYHFAKDGQVRSYPIGIGRDHSETPIGVRRVIRKKENPTWFPTKSIRDENPDLPKAVPPGKDNPLGAYAIYIGYDAYAIHGTNKPGGVGRRISHGCIRMYAAHIRDLFARVSVGTPVSIVHQDVKLGWDGDRLYLEAHPTIPQVTALEAGRRIEADSSAGIGNRIIAKLGDKRATVDWDIVREVMRRRDGIPTEIARTNAFVMAGMATSQTNQR